MKYDVIISGIYEYIGTPRKKLKGKSKLYVVSMQRAELDYNRMFYPVLTDKSRSVGPTKNIFIMPEERAVMHHMTYVRYNEQELIRKFEGHGHFIRLGNVQDYRRRVENIKAERFEFVEDQFNILPYWTGEFAQVYERFIHNNTDGTKSQQGV